MMNDEEAGSRTEQRGLDRILALSDGVFAFAITLLVLSLAVPVFGGSSAPLGTVSPFTLDYELLVALSKESLAFTGYAISFFVIGMWWMAHHRLFRRIVRYDNVLMWRNMFFLLFITIIPFLTELLDQYGDIQIAVAIYNLSQVLGGLALASLWNHAANKHLLITKSLTESQIRNIRIRNYVPSITFLIAAVVAFLIPPASGFPPSTANFVLFGIYPLMRLLSKNGGNQKD